MFTSRKSPYFPHRSRDCKIPGKKVDPKRLKKSNEMYKLKLKFYYHRGGELMEETPSMGEGKGYFPGYTLQYNCGHEIFWTSDLVELF